MLNFEITDIKGRKTVFTKPLRMNIISSSDAAADSFDAVFGISGRIPVLQDVRVSIDGETVFFGYIDEQTESLSEKGRLLSVRARSIEAVLLDNEAAPQQYFMPSMPLLMERHFVPLGFNDFVGSAEPFNGELVISKGESEWEVLCSFCEKFLRTKPRILENGIIDISGNDTGESIFIGRGQGIISMKKTLRRSAVISDIYARTYGRGGYEMHLKNKSADELGVRRVRYVNTLIGRKKSITDTEKLLDASVAAAYRCELNLAGSIICRVGDTLAVEGEADRMKITEIHRTYSCSGEKTRIFAEVKKNVDRQEHDA